MSDYYADLGVDRGASAEEIKRAYRRLARKLHPDVNPGPESEERFKVVSRAYEVLSDPDKRRSYDLGVDPFAQAGDGFAGAGFPFGEVFEAFFGAGAGTQRGPRSRRQRGQDALVRIDLDLRDAVFGTNKEITIETAVVCSTCHGEGSQPGTGTATCALCHGRGEVQSVQRSFLGQVMTTRPCANCSGFGTVITHPCFECSGDGRVRTRRPLTFRVPAGVDTGTRIQLSGQGEVGPGGGPAGDLYAEVSVRPHPSFVRRGDDLHCRLELPMTAAALGATIELDTFDDRRSLDIGAGTQHGDTLTLRGLGVTHLRGAGRGDLIVHADIQTPTRLSDAQADLLREFARLRGEERPTATVAPTDKGFLGKLRDAFKGA